jgi:ribosome-binding factor A
MLQDGGETPHALGGSGRSRRIARISERIREAVSEIILFQLKDPRIGFVTVLDVEVTADVKEATVMISVIGSPAQQKLTLAAIEHSRGYIQRLVGRQLKTRNTPILHFRLDEKTEKMRELDDILDRIRRERLAREGGAAAPLADEGAPPDDVEDEPPESTEEE